MLQQLTKLKETVGFSPVSGPLKHTKIKDLVLLQTQITFYLQRLEYAESFTPTKTKQLLMFKRNV